MLTYFRSNYYQTLIMQNRARYLINYTINLIRSLGFVGDIEPPKNFRLPFVHGSPVRGQNVVTYFSFKLQNGDLHGDITLSKSSDGDNVMYGFDGNYHELGEFISKHSEPIFEGLMKIKLSEL